MPDTIRGVVFPGDGTYEVREFPMPDPPPGGAVLAVEAVGLCASDVAQLHGHPHVGNDAFPVVPGHEVVGRVHALAPDADLGVGVGQRVGLDLVLRDRSGILVYGYSFGLDDRSGLWGGYAEYMEIRPGTHLVSLPDDVPAEHLSLFEPLASAVNWIEMARVGPGDTVVIQGPGHMGLICLAVALHQGAGTCIVTGTARDGLRLEAARRIGAAHTVDVDTTDPIEAVREVTGGRMADVVMDLADTATSTVSNSVHLAGFGGRIVLAGLKHMAPAEIISDLVVFKSLTILGGSGSTPATMDRAGELLRAHALPTDELLGEVFTLDELDEAMALLTRTADHDAVRVGLVHRH